MWSEECLVVSMTKAWLLHLDRYSGVGEGDRLAHVSRLPLGALACTIQEVNVGALE